ncbi:MAG: hypothetical protein ACR2FU_09625 [Streptosporangiaceae bacterium]
MHPQIIAMAAAEHVKDMQAQATRGRRARAARRARRGGILVTAAPPAELSAFRGSPAGPAPVPCPEQPCAPVPVKAA